jgi:Glycerophosphoryl diester phosphodiesterase family
MKVGVVLAAVLIAVAGCSPRTDGSGSRSDSCATVIPARATGHPTLDRWLASRPLYVAQRGGGADWVEGTADAYRKAANWNPQLALEVPVWLTADGVWVVSHDATTGRVFDQNDDIRSSNWTTLSKLRTKIGGHRMARLVNDILIPYGSTRILFIDNKADAQVDTFFNLLDSYAGNTRYVAKGYYTSTNTATAARRRGYLTWGYYYDRDMGKFAATQSRFDLLGLNDSAPASDFATMRATGRPVLAHVIPNASSASAATCKGASGYMVSGVEEVVPHA